MRGGVSGKGLGTYVLKELSNVVHLAFDGDPSRLLCSFIMQEQASQVEDMLRKRNSDMVSFLISDL